jgi:hypothetical protein
LLSEEVSGPVAAPEAAEQAGLTEAGARRALKRLARTGFVERLGGGRTQQYRFREEDPLARQLLDLFRAERDRYESLLSELRSLFAGFPEVALAWIDDPPVEVGKPLHLGIMASSNSLSYLNEELRRRIVGLEGLYDLTIEIHTFSRADLPEIDWGGARLLAGHPMTEPSEGSEGEVRSHAERVERSERMSRAIAELLDQDSSLRRRAERHLEYLLEHNQGSAGHDLREWRDILKHYSKQRLKDFLVSDTPRAQRLRQSSPFFAVLDSTEREEILDRATGEAG